MVDYTELIKHFGILGVVILFLWRAAPVVWSELIVKWSDRGLKFFDKLETSLETTVTAHQQHKQQSERHEDLSWRIYDKVEGLDEKCDRILKEMGMQPSEPRRSRRRKAQQSPANEPPPPAAASSVSPPTSPPTSSSPPS